MYVRFVVDERHQDSLAKAGVFVVAYRLRGTRSLPKHDHQQLDEVLTWFDNHLEAPSRFNRSGRPNRPPKAISWFKPTAIEHIRRIRDLARLIERQGILVQQINVRTPGYVVFEDEHQVVAEPFSSVRLL